MLLSWFAHLDGTPPFLQPSTTYESTPVARVYIKYRHILASGVRASQASLYCVFKQDLIVGRPASSLWAQSTFLATQLFLSCFILIAESRTAALPGGSNVRCSKWFAVFANVWGWNISKFCWPSIHQFIAMIRFQTRPPGSSWNPGIPWAA